ncbi:MAG TPA: Maf family protein [Phycisphaerae bacterium]|nr:Maf family protein [Phycisphaerae bacterium]
MIPPLVLASSSPRRRQLLADAGLSFDVVPPPFGEPEELPEDLTPTRRAEALAYFKARAVAECRPEACVLGADTIVAADGRVLGKPADRADAERMLRGLSGTRHAVITGVALLMPCGRRLIASETTYVTMRPMTEQEIADYLASGEWIGKAGAYAIQETADRFVVGLEGSFSNVVGLPVELVERLIGRAGEPGAAERE